MRLLFLVLCSASVGAGCTPSPACGGACLGADGGDGGDGAVPDGGTATGGDGGTGDAGRWLWAVQAGLPHQGDATVTSVSASADGAAYLTGVFSGTATFGATRLTSTPGRNIFLARVDADGTHRWAVNLGRHPYGSDTFVSALAGGGCLVAASGDAFLSRYDATGARVWAAGVDGVGATALSTLADGTAYVAGTFSRASTFGTTTLTPLGGNDLFLAKYNPNGTLAWAVRAGGTSSDDATSVATLADGTVYLAGAFQGTATFGATALSARGWFDVFLAKYNPDGTVAWAVRAGPSALLDGGASGDSARATSVSTLASGAVYVGGSFEGPATFGAYGLSSAGGVDGFLAKYDASGTPLWAIAAGGAQVRAVASLTDGTVSVLGADGALAHYDGSGVAATTPIQAGATALGVLGDGTAYLAGGFVGTATLGAAVLTAAGRDDLFLAKYNPDATLAWAVQAGLVNGSSTSTAGVSTLPNGTAFVTGAFSGRADFSGATLTSSGESDVFLAAYGADGGLKWAVAAGGTSSDVARGVAALADGGAYLTGSFRQTATFGSTTLTATAFSEDVFLAKYNPDGTVAWAFSAGGVDPASGAAVAALADGTAFVTGSFFGTVTFGTKTVTSAGQEDVFLAKVDSSGAVEWAVRAGGGGSDQGSSVAALADGTAYVSGSFQGTATFGTVTLTATAPSNWGGFLAKYRADGSVAWAVQADVFDIPSVAAAADGSAYVTGQFISTATFGSTTLTEPSGSGDIFLAKYEATGALAWAVRLGGAGRDFPGAVSTLADGTVFLTGSVEGAATLGSTALAGTGFFLAKYGADGTLAWATPTGSADYQSYGSAAFVSASADGTATVAGDFFQVADFGGITLVANTAASYRNVFLARHAR